MFKSATCTPRQTAERFLPGVLVMLVQLALTGLATTALGQMQWSSYDTSGNLVTANVATGGDLASATSVTFTIPASTQLFFVTKNFTPFSLAGANCTTARDFQRFRLGRPYGRGATHHGMGSVQLRQHDWFQ